MKKYIDILKNLIKIESVNNNEKIVAEYIESIFKRYKNVEIKIIDSFKGRSNIIIKVKGKKSGRILAFSGHLDVVEVGDGWTYPPFEGKVIDNKMYGRGTSDMKGGVAASIYAILDIIESDIYFEGELWFIGTVGEELGMQGALELVEGRYLDKVDAIIIPEPTKVNGENQAIFASKGSIMYTITAIGKAAHSSMPNLGINALMTMVNFITITQSKFDNISSMSNFQNKNLGSSLNVFSMINGGKQVNSVPDKVILKGNIRTVPEFSSNAAIDILKSSIEDNNKDDKKAKLSLELDQVLDPAEAKKDNELIEYLLEVTPDKNIKTCALIGTCELSRYIHISDSIQLLVYGPGLTNKAHTVDEYIELEEYFDTINIFKNLAIKFLNKK